MRKRRTIIALVVLSAGLIAWLAHRGRDSFSPGIDRLLLLLPDGTDVSDPRVTAWLDAASEEGLHLVPMHDSSFLGPLLGVPRCAGVILPDSIHLAASDLLVNAIRKYVAGGGKLMLVYDAATKSLEGLYARDRSRMSDLAGVDYGLYNSLRAGMIRSSDVSGTNSVMNQLGVPPGKYYPLSSQAASDLVRGDETFSVQLRRYKYGDLEYPSFVTSGEYAGEVLLRSPAGIVAGHHPYKNGSVLFVNLPLGYLDGFTDGLPLHVFLKYFARQVLSLPYLLAVPDGIGGLVLNWHVDSNAAIKALQVMNTWTILKQGPYSIDITAGPDTYAFGDNKGFNVLENSLSQEFIHEYARLGNEIGSHGGWIHNYFAAHVDTDNPKEMAKFLELNNDALARVAGKPVLEYSAPTGNQPQWVTRWLEERHFVGYYFTGNTGMAPTQGYRDGQRSGQSIWAFPILHLDRAASFEEMGSAGYSDALIERWLDLATHFTVAHRQVRLIYFHPPGILPYHDVVLDWMKITARLREQGVFRWYTMVEIGNFLNARKMVNWKLAEHEGLASLETSAPRTLAHQTWRFPKRKFGHPRIVEGTAAAVLEDDDGWLVIAGEGNHLKVETRLLEK
jgi:hypothetical protein